MVNKKNDFSVGSLLARANLVAITRVSASTDAELIHRHSPVQHAIRELGRVFNKTPISRSVDIGIAIVEDELVTL